MDMEVRTRWLEVGRRLKAARIQAGYESRKEFAATHPLPRFGRQVLAQVETGQRELHEHEAEVLARFLPVTATYLLEGDGHKLGPIDELNVKIDVIASVIAKHLGIDVKEFSTALEAIADRGANGDAQPPGPAPDPDDPPTGHST